MRAVPLRGDASFDASSQVVQVVLGLGGGLMDGAMEQVGAYWTLWLGEWGHLGAGGGVLWMENINFRTSW